MNSFQNKEIKKAYNGKIIALIVSTILCIVGITLIVIGNNIGKKLKADPADFGEVYYEDRLEEDIYVYVDITEDPTLICSYDDGEEYFLVTNSYDEGYIVRCSESEFKKIKDEIRQNGSTRIVGGIFNLNDEVNDYLREEFSEVDIDSDEYFQGKCLNVNGGGADAIYYAFGAISLMLGGILLIVALYELISYNKTLKNLSDVDIAKIESELNSPATVYYKKVRTFITPNYIVSLGNKFNIVRFDDIILAYRFIQRYNFVTILSNIKMWTKSGSREVCVADKAGFGGKAKSIHEEILAAIAHKNPEVSLGYDMNMINTIKAEKKAAKKK